jgi:hypothetical protein
MAYDTRAEMTGVVDSARVGVGVAGEAFVGVLEKTLASLRIASTLRALSVDRRTIDWNTANTSRVEARTMFVVRTRITVVTGCGH